MVKRTLALFIVLCTFALTACTETFTYEAEPTSDDKDPRQVECFAIEADSSNGDDGDRQLGTFCKDARSDTVEDDD